MTQPDPVPLFMVEVVIDPLRVCDGFCQRAYLVIYDSLTPALCLCVHRYDRPINVYAALESEEVANIVHQAAWRDPDTIAESMLLDLYDPKSEQEKARMEVNSGRDQSQ